MKVGVKPEVLLRLCLVVMLLMSVLSIARSVTNTFAASGATDFHSYWYYGHFIRQGANPYRAFFADEKPSVPVKYLDGVITETLPIAQSGLAAVPANTAPIVLLLSIFSLVSWPLAKTLWMLCNLVLMFVIPWLVIRLLFYGNSLRVTRKLLICFAFYGLLGTRVTIGNGQTTLFVFALMLGTLLAMGKNWLASGIMLGFALSKYSLALPVFLFSLYKQKYRTIGTSLLVQVIGLLSVSFLGGDSPLLIAEDYFLMAQHHAARSGIHLASLFLFFNEDTLTIAILFGTSIVLGLSILWCLRSDKLRRQVPVISFAEFHLVTILTLWTLLVAYHQVYDTLVAILFFALIIYGLERPELWRLSQRQRSSLTATLIVSAFLLSLPGTFMASFLPGSILSTYLDVINNAITVTLVLMLGTSVWLLYQIHEETVVRDSTEG